VPSLSLLNLYITANLLLVLAAAGIAAMRWLSQRLRIAHRQQLQLAYALTLAAVLLPVALLPVAGHVLTPKAQVWSGATMRQVTTAAEVPQLVIAVVAAEVTLPWQMARRASTVLLGGGALLFMTLLARDARRLRRILRGAHCIVRRGSVRVLASDTVYVPFSFWWPRRHCIVLPAELMLRADDLRMAIQHESQHHRQLDTRLIYFYQLLRAVFWVNPAMHWLQAMVTDLQEFACDEALLARRRLPVRAYCACLLRVAELALGQRRSALSMGMLGNTPGRVLHDRVAAMLSGPPPSGRGSARWVGALLLVVMAGTALAASATVQDRRISLQQATAMAVAARAGSDFPIVVNQRVVRQLNRLLGTPDGRAFVRASLQRMQQYQPLITAKTAQYGLPAELIAVPLVESGFRNLPRSNDPRHGAGLWMFIAPTAQRFGLAVDDRVDERLDVAAQTDAAMRMLLALRQSFGDWGLALLAYNAGSRTVERAIEETGSRDVWHIIERGYENDSDYVAGVIAALLIIRNPASAD
jgi:beta-lactamase regulating signal transducer with metallopeptidase domain